MTTLLEIAPAAADAERAAGPLRFELVTDATRLHALADAWRELLDASAAPEPMLSPEWLSAWWDHYGGGRSLTLGLFYRDEQLVGLAPLCSRPHTYRRGLTFERLAFLGADGDEPDGVCSDYLNLIARRGFEECVAEAFVNHLWAGEFGAWDECVLDNMDTSSAMPQILKDAFTSMGGSVETTMATQAPYAVLPPTWDAFLASLPKKKRSSLRSAWREFEGWSNGAYRIERVTCVNSLAEGRAILKSLHQQRWEEAGQRGVFASPRFESFHEGWMRHLLTHNQLELAWLTVRGEPIAAAYGFRSGDRLYYYQCGRELDVPPRVRPGIILLQLLLRDAMTRGVREFDFLGGPARYKSLFSRASRPLVRLRLARPFWRESMRRTLVACRLWLQRLRNRFRESEGSTY